MAERVASIPLEAGLYVLRYSQALATDHAPRIFVRSSPGSEQAITVMSAPGEEVGAISSPGGCVVVRAERSSSLHVTIHSASRTGGTEAELRLESLTGETRPLGVGQSDRHEGTSAEPGPRLELLGHVSRRGDVRVRDDVWIAGPDSPAPIEGLDLRIAEPMHGLGLEYQVMIGGTWTAWSQGGFAGTRGQARPLLGARIRLVGDRASSFEIEAEGLFLGAAIKRFRGQIVEVLSDSGMDPMVGLKLSLAAVPQRSRTPAEAPRASQKPVSSAPQNHSPARSGRVRVFRSAGIR